MLTLTLTLQSAGDTTQQLALGILKPEWLGLVSNFVRMPADERARLSHSIQAAVAHNPFPTDGSALSPHEQAICDTFVSDCVLLAALAEATTKRVLSDTPLTNYLLAKGNALKAQFN